MRITPIPRVAPIRRAKTWRAAGLAGLSLVILVSPSLPAQGPGRSPQANPAVDAAPRPADPEPVILNSRTFNIPFRVDASRANPVQVDLFVSRGDGEPWQRADRQPPTIQEFRFAAPDDGVYWFATQTLDEGGRSHPNGPIAPQLRVNVDTTPPVIELDAEADDRGNVEVTLSVRDASPLRGVQLQYATDATRQWRPVAVETPDTSEDADVSGRHSLTRRPTFTPEGAWQETYLHVVAIDAAGNQQVATQRVQRPRVASRGAPSLAGYRTPGITRPVSAPADPQYGVTRGQLPAPAAGNRSDEFSLNPPAQADPGRAQADQGLSQADPGRAQAEQGSAQGDQGWGHSQIWSSAPNPANDEGRQADSPRPSSAAEALRPIDPDSLPEPADASLSASADASRPRRDREPEPSGPRTPARTPTAAPLPQSQPNDLSTRQNRIPLPTDDRDRADWSTEDDPSATGNLSESSVAGDSRGGAEATIDLAELERRVPVRFSNSVRFSLDYELEAVGSRGVDSVELWGTTDAGKRWKRWGIDPDLTSPFDIETLGEGIFGYRSVVVGQNGLVSPTPRDGDPPDIVVVVDTTKPQVRLTSVRYGEGDRVGSLVIRYECRDKHLASRPITLSFSDRPDGPWTTIAAGLRNEGEYLWPADPELPRKLYLRIDAIDRADNVGTYILDQPIDAQGLAPRAKIRSFRPVTRNLRRDESGRDESGVTAARQTEPRR